MRELYPIYQLILMKTSIFLSLFIQIAGSNMSCRKDEKKMKRKREHNRNQIELQFIRVITFLLGFFDRIILVVASSTISRTANLIVKFMLQNYNRLLNYLLINTQCMSLIEFDWKYATFEEQQNETRVIILKFSFNKN